MPERTGPSTKEAFSEMVQDTRASAGYTDPAAFAIGLSTVEDGRSIDSWFFTTNYNGANMGAAAALAIALDHEDEGLATGEYLLSQDETNHALALTRAFHQDPVGSHPNIDALQAIKGAALDENRLGGYHPRGIKDEFFDEDNPTKSLPTNPRVATVAAIRSWEDVPHSVADTYLRLYAMSEREQKPNTINLDGIFKYLPNVVRTESLGNFTPDSWNQVRDALAVKGFSTQVRNIDKFPRMVDYITPRSADNIRIADGGNVRLGAHLAPGTTVMPAGFVNFNAGTLGEAMIEGRVSQGVTIGAGSDLGGGSSTMGTLSGGGTEKISVGERSLIGANAGIGISLGDDCIVEAGTYITAGTQVSINNGLKIVKAGELSGVNGLIFRRNSQSGVVEALPSRKNVELNSELH